MQYSKVIYALAHDGNVLGTFRFLPKIFTAPKDEGLILKKFGAGDGDRTRDVQLGKFIFIFN
jgi:hypothetical protein